MANKLRREVISSKNHRRMNEDIIKSRRRNVLFVGKEDKCLCIYEQEFISVAIIKLFKVIPLHDIDVKTTVAVEHTDYRCFVFFSFDKCDFSAVMIGSEMLLLRIAWCFSLEF